MTVHHYPRCDHIKPIRRPCPIVLLVSSARESDWRLGRPAAVNPSARYHRHGTPAPWSCCCARRGGVHTTASPSVDETVYCSMDAKAWTTCGMKVVISSTNVEVNAVAGRNRRGAQLKFKVDLDAAKGTKALVSYQARKGCTPER